MLELDIKRCSDSIFQISLEVEVVCRGSRWHWRMEEPGIAQIDAAEEFPVALEFRLKHVVVRLAGKALKQLVQSL